MPKLALWRQVEDMSVKERAIYFDACISEDEEIWDSFVPHNEKYIKARGSFHTSKEWKDFRDFFLFMFPNCVECGKPANTVHHTEPFTIDKTVITEGFLAPLKDFTRFESMCQDCHYEGHSLLIVAEAAEGSREAREKAEAYYFRNRASKAQEGIGFEAFDRQVKKSQEGVDWLGIIKEAERLGKQGW